MIPTKDQSVVAIYESHTQAEAAIMALHRDPAPAAQAVMDVDSPSGIMHVADATVGTGANRAAALRHVLIASPRCGAVEGRIVAGSGTAMCTSAHSAARAARVHSAGRGGVHAARGRSVRTPRGHGVGTRGCCGGVCGCCGGVRGGGVHAGRGSRLCGTGCPVRGSGAAACRLGPTVLRTSTAGTVAAAVLLSRSNRWS